MHVPLGLVQRKRQSKRQGDISPDKGSSLYQETEITQTLEHEEFLEQVILQTKSPQSQGKRIAIIGEPGSGKTTLLQQIAQWVVHEVKEIAVICVSLSSLEGKTLEEYLLQRWLKDALQLSSVTQDREDNFVDWFKRSQVCLLLDGLDEMPSSINNSPLQSIATQTTGWISQARIFITCRLNLWDSRINPLDMFDTYRILDFDYPKQVEQFIENWFLPQGEAGVNQGTKLCKVLKEPGIERIRDLIKNPLRLTLLCLSYYSNDGQLPETKADLYQHFVEDFYGIKYPHFPTTIEQRKELNEKLSELAHEAIDKESSRFCLREDLIIKFMGESGNEDSLFHLALKLGWLNKVGVDATNPHKYVYAFLHATFQEYFAALAIDDWHFFLNHNNENPQPDVECDSALIYNNGKPIYRIFQPEWRGVMILWIGLPSERVTNSSKEEFIGLLRKFQDGTNFHSYFDTHAYILAAQLASEIKNYPDEEIFFTSILRYSFGYYNYENKKWTYHPESQSKELRENLFQLDSTKLIKYLLAVVTTDRSNKVLRQIARLLGKIGTGKLEASHALMNLVLQSSETPVAYEALRNLQKIGIYDSNTIKSLATLFNETESSRLKSKIISFVSDNNYCEEFYSYISDNDKNVALKTLSDNNLLTESVDYSLNTQIPALDDLSVNLAQSDKLKALTQEMVEFLYKSDDLKSLQQCAWKLRELGTGNTEVCNALIYVLLKATDVDTIWYMTDSIKSVTSTNGLAKVVVTSLKDHFTQEVRSRDENIFQSLEKIICHCAKFLSYQQFCYLLGREDS